MFRYPGVLIVLVVFLFISSNIAAASNTRPTKTSPISFIPMSSVANHSSGRALRSKSTETKDDDRNNFVAQERAGSLSFLSKFKMYSKIWLWLEMGKSDDYTKKALGLEGLSGQALKTHPNYKYFTKFAYRTEGHRLGKLLKKDTSTSTLWDTLKLGKVPLDQVLDTPAFKTYLRYMLAFEEKVTRTRKRCYDAPDLVFWNASPEEIMVKVYIWATFQKPEEYVLAALGLKGLQETALTSNPRFQYFKLFVDWSKTPKTPE